MNKELAILQLADYKELFENGRSSCYLIINNKLEEYPCMFGFTELSDDLEEVKELFRQVEERARELGQKHLIGPVNYTTWMSYRWAISQYDQKYYPDCENPPYYVDYIRQLGYRELYTYRSAHINTNNVLFESGEEIFRKKKEEGFEFRLYRGEESYQIVKDIFDVSIDAFQGSLLYSEIPFEVFQEIYLEWTKKIPEIHVFAAYKDGKAAGYVMSYANPYDAAQYISKTVGVRKEYQKQKLYVALLYFGTKFVRELGYDQTVYHFQCEQRSTFKRYDSTVEDQEKRYAVFVKELKE